MVSELEKNDFWKIHLGAKIDEELPRENDVSPFWVVKVKLALLQVGESKWIRVSSTIFRLQNSPLVSIRVSSTLSNSKCMYGKVGNKLMCVGKL